MAIDFNIDIVETLFATNVASDPAYQIPGTFDLPDTFGVVALASGVIAALGTTYLANDHITLSGGTFTRAAVLKVLTVDGSGHVLTFSILDGGEYSDIPTNPISTTDNSIAGSGFTLTASWNGLAQQRLLTFIEIMRSYLYQIDNTHEAKLLHEVIGRMMATMKFGQRWNNTDIPINAQKDAIRFIAGHILASDL